jgi:predicted transcriptional regulator
VEVICCPVTINPEDRLAVAQAKMKRGGFYRVPVVTDRKLVGIPSDRDVRLPWGSWNKTASGPP